MWNVIVKPNWMRASSFVSNACKASVTPHPGSQGKYRVDDEGQGNADQCEALRGVAWGKAATTRRNLTIAIRVAAAPNSSSATPVHTKSYGASDSRVCVRPTAGRARSARRRSRSPSTRSPSVARQVTCARQRTEHGVVEITRRSPPYAVNVGPATVGRACRRWSPRSPGSGAGCCRRPAPTCAAVRSR